MTGLPWWVLAPVFLLGLLLASFGAAVLIGQALRRLSEEDES